MIRITRLIPTSLFKKKGSSAEIAVTETNGKKDDLVSKNKGKKKLRKQLLIGGAAALVLAIAGFMILKPGGDAQQIARTDVATIAQKDLIKSVNINGNVASATHASVNSTSTAQVKEIYVKVGDQVHAGQPLAKLDETTVANQIKAQETSLQTTQATSGQQIASARQAYAHSAEQLNKGLNSAVNSAQTAQTTASENYNKAVAAYERLRDSRLRGLNETQLAQEAALNGARNNLQNAEMAYAQAVQGKSDASYSAYDDNYSTISESVKINELEKQRKLTSDPIKQAEIDQQIETLRATVRGKEQSQAERRRQYKQAENQVETARKGVASAKEALNLAERQFQASLAGLDNQVADAQTAVNTAFNAHKDATVGLSAAQLAARQHLQTQATAVSSAQAAAAASTAGIEVQLAQLRGDLAKTTITSPVTGTVTAVNVEVGATPAGPLFVVEDLNRLIVKVNLKEQDVTKITVGIPVTFKTGITDDEEFKGTVALVSPAAVKAQQSSAAAAGGAGAGAAPATSAEVIFPTEINMAVIDPRFRAGASVRAKLITQREDKALTAPREAVITEGDKSYVLVLQPADGDKVRVERLEVTTGLSNDMDIVIKSEKLKEGTQVISYPDKYMEYEGKTVPIVDGPSAKEAPAGGALGL
ncbi:MAG: HlyD family efflux transporter periplasmic adaptor subunit [Actinomycetaceae bacterium]|nr:HlyD family efflux transporter periplasmic adaptor subunit [Actinomycetaceae bacterium]